MRIAYIYHLDAADPGVQSGRPASILAELLHLGLEIEPVFPLHAKTRASWMVKKLVFRLLGRHYRWDREPRRLAAFARECEARIVGKKIDMVFSPGSEVISHLQTDLPVAFCADATFANLLDYYQDFAHVSPGYEQQGHRQETAALSRAQLAVYPSEWAARSAVDTYGAEPNKVAVIPFGPNLGGQNTREQVWKWIEGRTRDVIRLLFVGRNWERKGGDTVVATAEKLIQAGHRVELDIVGSGISRSYFHISWIRQHGLLSPRVPEDVRRLNELFANAHYLFVPSRAEAYGMTFAEGNAFGLPVIATATGGIPSIIRHGWNGFLLPLSEGAEDYAETISSSFGDPGKYQQLCRQAFDEFEARLNWRAFCRRFLEHAAQCGCIRNHTGLVASSP
jgi:glycosyltransferase involved in cell wall biosynthesis